MKREDRIMRANMGFIDDLDQVKLDRLNNKLEKKMISNTELTRMARNSSVYKKLLEELSTIPRRGKHAK